MSVPSAGATSNSIEHLENLKIPQRIERLPITSYQRLLGFVIVICWFFDCVDLGAMTFLLPTLAKHFQLTPVMMGALVSMSFVGMLLGTAFSGLFSDRYGRKKVLQWAMVLWGIAGILCSLSWSILSLFFFRFLLGLGLGSELPVAHAMLPEFLPKQARGRYVSVMEGLLPIGIITAGILTYFVLPYIGWRYVFVAEAIPAAWIFVARRNLPESPRWLAVLLVGKGFAIIKSINFVIIITIGGIPRFLVATYLIEKIGRKPVVITATAMTAVSSYWYGNVSSLPFLYTWGFLLQFFTYAMWPSIYAYTPELYPTRMRSTGCGLSSSVGRVGAILGPYIIGAVLASSGPGAVFDLAAFMFGLAALSVLILGPETRGRILEEISQ